MLKVHLVRDDLTSDERDGLPGVLLAHALEAALEVPLGVLDGRHQREGPVLLQRRLGGLDGDHLAAARTRPPKRLDPLAGQGADELVPGTAAAPPRTADVVGRPQDPYVAVAIKDRVVDSEGALLVARGAGGYLKVPPMRAGTVCSIVRSASSFSRPQ